MGYGYRIGLTVSRDTSLVLVNESAESVASDDLADGRRGLTAGTRGLGVRLGQVVEQEVSAIVLALGRQASRASARMCARYYVSNSDHADLAPYQRRPHSPRHKAARRGADAEGIASSD